MPNDDPAALAARAADSMETTLDAEHGEGDLPENLAAQLRAGIRMLRESTDTSLANGERKKILKAALQQLQTPPMLFFPHEVTRTAESARMLADRASRAL